MEPWKQFQEHIATRLHPIDPKARSTKGSGNQGEAGDVKNDVDLCIECKLRNTKDITIKNDVWNKLCGEIPFHSKKIPMYALENEDKKRWVVLNLDDFLDIYVEWWEMKYGTKQT